MAFELGRVYDRAKRLNRRLTTGERKEKKQRSMEEWQKRWDLATKGRWTYRLIGDIQVWVERKHRETDYYLTQFLTGHGCYREYLQRFGHDYAMDCSFCGSVNENAEHIFLSCPRYAFERTPIETLIGERVTPDNIIKHMLQSNLVWTKVKQWAANVIQELRRKEWQRSSERRQNNEEDH